MAADTERIALGRLEILFSGQDFIRDAVLEETRFHGTDTGACTGRLACRFGAVEVPVAAAVRVDRFLVGPDVVQVRDRLLPHSLCRDGAGLGIAVRSGTGAWRRRPVGAAVRLLDQSYNDAARRLAKRFLYTILDQAVQLAQLPLGQTWVHASAVTGGGRTVLFPAWGGVGKTAVLLSLLETGHWRFLADDLAALDVAGTVYRTPQRMQVFAVNVAGQDGLRERVLAGRSVADRTHWAVRRRLLGPRAVRRRMHPEEVFGVDAAAASGALTDAVYLRRTTAARFSARIARPRELAGLGAAVLPVELHPLDRWLAAISGAVQGTAWPTATEVSSRAEAIIEAGLTAAGCRCTVVDVPPSCRPEEIREFVEDRVLA
jgi:hypothetical protein